MKTEKRYLLKLGIFITLGIAIFIIGIYYIGSNQNLFKSNVKINAYFNDVKGLKVGNNINFSGINIGTVSNIVIENDTIVKVEMAIQENVKIFIKKDSKVEISTEGIMGSKNLMIFPGTPNSESIEEGDILLSRKTINVEDILSETERIIEKVSVIADNLNEISEKINHGKGDLGQLINSSSITDKLEIASSNFLSLTNELNEISKKVNNGEGDISKLINEDMLTTQLSDIMVQLNEASQNANRFTKELEETVILMKDSNNVMSKVLYDTLLAYQIDTTIINVNTGIEEIVETAQAIEESWVVNLFSKKKKKKK
jgi:phospholipid/cholesterol/gamma-HCH transport system substrate-binding protein